MSKLKLTSEFFTSCNSFIKFILIFEFVEFTVVFIGFLYFNLVYYNHPMTLKYRSYFEKLPIFNKILAIWFSIVFAIPNKIFINNKLNKFVVTLSIILLIMISNVFPPFILLYIIFWLLVLESYFFAVFYEDNISFRNFINNNLFNGDSQFAKEYFSFFWGNMKSGGAGSGKAGAVGTIFGGLYNVARNSEKNHVKEQGKIETQTHIDNAVNKPKTPEESLAIQQKVEEHVLERDTVILKGEKVLEWLKDS
nr:hypothetical protein [Nitzschia traheaformis]